MLTLRRICLMLQLKKNLLIYLIRKSKKTKKICLLATIITYDTLSSSVKPDFSGISLKLVIAFVLMII